MARLEPDPILGHPAELAPGETLVSYIPEPDLTARRRIILALLPSFAFLVIVAPWAFTDGQQFLLAAAGVYLLVAWSIYALRLCRTSYVVSTRRVIRFVGGKKVEQATLAEIAQPVLLDFAASGSFVWRWMARFMSLGPVVEARRLKPEPWTIAAFLTSRDLSRLRIGYPGHSLPIAQIFDDLTLAWASAHDIPKATP
jgi:hypothetical protein